MPSTTTGSSIMTPVVLSILAAETGERFAFFGFRAVLALYFTSLDYEETEAIALYSLVTSLAYLSPLPGALLADGYFGRYRTILYFGWIYTVGLFIVTYGAASSDSSLLFRRIMSFSGLFLVCLGTGGLKSCVSAFGADQVAAKEENDGIMDENTDSEGVRLFFSYFYFCINVGALVSIAIVPIIRAHFGFGSAFLVPSIFMVCVMFVFISKRREYVHVEPGSDGTSLTTTARYFWWLLRRNLAAVPVLSPVCWFLSPRDLDEVEPESDAEYLQQQQLDDASQVLRVLPIIALFPVFWTLYDQQNSAWTMQAKRMDLHGLEPEQLGVINPLEIMIFIPLFNQVIYPFLQSKGWNMKPLRRMAWGMLLCAIAFTISGFIESTVQHRAENKLPQLSVFWQIPQITILAISEIFFSVTGLEFTYATSPKRLKAFLMGVSLLGNSIGNMFSSVLYSTVFASMNRATVMHVCSGLMVINLGVFLFSARWWEKHGQHRQLVRSSSAQGIELQD